MLKRCNGIIFNRATGCPSVAVDLSFPEIDFCSGPGFVPPILKAKLPRPPLLLPQQDIPGTDIKCIDIRPITNVNVGDEKLEGDFSPQSDDCAAGQYRLKYNLNVDCALNALPSIVPIYRAGVSVGQINFKVSNCSLNIDPRLTCFTCTPTLGDGCRELNIDMPVDIPIYFGDRPDDAENDLGELNYWQLGCAFGGSIKLYNTCISIRENLHVDFDFGTPGANFSPVINGCKLENYTLDIKLPDPKDAFEIVAKEVDNNFIVVNSIDGGYCVKLLPYVIKTGPTGHTGYSGTSPNPTSIFGSRGTRGMRGSIGTVGTAYKLVIDDYRGSRGPTGIKTIIREECERSYKLWPEVVQRYTIKVEALDSVDMAFDPESKTLKLNRHVAELKFNYNYYDKWVRWNRQQEIPVTVI